MTSAAAVELENVTTKGAPKPARDPLAFAVATVGLVLAAAALGLSVGAEKCVGHDTMPPTLFAEYEETGGFRFLLGDSMTAAQKTTINRDLVRCRSLTLSLRRPRPCVRTLSRPNLSTDSSRVLLLTVRTARFFVFLFCFFSVVFL